MKKVELVFVPAPWLGHVVSTVEAAKLLLEHDHDRDCDGRLSITVLIMKLSKDRVIDGYTQKISSDPNTPPRLRFISLPSQNGAVQDTDSVFKYIGSQTNAIREVVADLINHSSESSSQLAGIVLDMFCSKFMDVAYEFNLPSYLFWTSGTCALGLTNHLVGLKYEQNQDLSQYRNSDAEFSISCFSNPVPAKVLPSPVVEEGPVSSIFMSYFKRMKEAKGIMINTFYELESYAIQALLNDDKFPKVYAVGPILNLGNEDKSRQSSADDIKNWLDDQPEKSVVFLCFGSMGSFEQPQVKEIAEGLEKSGSRFLWSLRKPGTKGIVSVPTEYEDFEQVLPEGFLERTKGVGKVIGWAPQVAVLAHRATGGFISHCGWNSTLESVWFGVPVATFPLAAEQQVNAFELVMELEMAVPIRIDYKVEESTQEIVGAEEIEEAIRRLMAEEDGSGVREKVKEMQKNSRVTLLEGGSSYNARSLFIQDVLRNM